MSDESPGGGVETATVHLAVFGEARALACEVRTGARTPLDLLLPARALTDHLSRASLEHVEKQGQRVTCARGCTACCRQLIPVSPIEARALADLVASMPPARRETVRARFAEAVRRMEAAGLLDPSAPRGRQALLASSAEATWDEISRRYYALRQDCPFLEANECSIYGERPLACREYQVTSPVALCEALNPELEATPRPVWMSEAMAAAGSAIAGTSKASVPLPLSLEWAEVHGAALDATKDGEAMFWTLLSVIDKQAKTPFEARASGGEGPGASAAGAAGAAEATGAAKAQKAQKAQAEAARPKGKDARKQAKSGRKPRR
jgi:Fe-S-cluster containining protein